MLYCYRPPLVTDYRPILLNESLRCLTPSSAVLVTYLNGQVVNLHHKGLCSCHFLFTLHYRFPLPSTLQFALQHGKERSLNVSFKRSES